MIGGLQYLSHTRKNLANVVGNIARFHADPIEAHYATIKRIFKYLKGTSKFGLWYDRSNDFTLSAYIDADWASSMDDRKKLVVELSFLEEDWFLN